MDVATLIRSRGGSLTPAERRVADLVLSDPHAVAFGTVASVARTAGTSGGSVVRLTARLGLAGFAELQERVRSDLTPDARHAADRIRQATPHDPLDRAVALAAESVRTTFERVDRATFDAAVRLLAARSRAVHVLAADASRGIGDQFATELAMLRPGVVVVGGNAVAVGRALAGLAEGDVVVTIDLPRYDRWVLDAVEVAHAAGARLVAVTDSALSPLARHAELVFTASSEAAGPFDSHVASLALFEALVAGVAAHLRRPASERLARIEAVWADALTGG